MIDIHGRPTRKFTKMTNIIIGSIAGLCLGCIIGFIKGQQYGFNEAIDFCENILKNMKENDN
jgi:hypothetical protein